MVDDRALHHQQGPEHEPANQLECLAGSDTAGHGDDSYLDSGDGVSLYDVRVDALHVVLDDTLVQEAERGLEATKETSLLHGLRVEPEEVVLAGLEDFRLCRQDGFVLDPRV